MSQGKGRYFPNPNHDEQQENSHSSEEQENPIYGNLGRDRRGEPGFCHPFRSNNGGINAVSLCVRVTASGFLWRESSDESLRLGVITLLLQLTGFVDWVQIP